MSTPSPVRPRWTASQQLAIQTTGQAVLVSAAAGSGKTSVLAERCAYLVCDAPKKCQVDELLVVTFTEAAAAEMRLRIGSALHERYAKDPSPHLARQLVLLDRAQISTIHSFCRMLIKQHFSELGLDPAFDLMGEEENLLLKRKIAEQLLEDRLAGAGSNEMARLIEHYANGSERSIEDMIIKCHNLLCSLVDPRRWSRDAIHHLRELADKPFEQTTQGRELLQKLSRRFELIDQQIDRGMIDLKALNNFASYVAYIQSIKSMLQEWKKLADRRDLPGLGAALESELDRLPTVSNSVPNKDRAKGIVDSIRSQLTGPWRDMINRTGDVQNDTREILPRAELIVSLVHDFDQSFSAEKHKRRKIDYSDLERYALELLQKPAIAWQCQRRYAQVLVDEYQDINELQDAILSRVCSRGENSTPLPFPNNLFCVGDVKQCIYRFRLAEPALFLQRDQQYRSAPAGAKVIDLQENFRSRGALLGAINATFERLMTRESVGFDYDEKHRLVEGAKYPQDAQVRTLSGSPIEFHLMPGDISVPASDTQDLDDNEREALLIAQRIKQLLAPDANGQVLHVMEKSKTGLSPRPIRLSDIAILLRTVSVKAGKYATVLRGQGIASFSDRGSEFFGAQEIRDIMTILNLLANQNQDIPLAAFVRSPIARVKEPENLLATVRLAYPDGPDGLSFHQAFYQYATDKQDEIATTIRDLSSQIDKWRRLANRESLANLVWEILRESDYLTYVNGLPDGNQRCANLMHFHELASDFADGSEMHGVKDFLDFLEASAEESEHSQPTLASESEDAVRIMSIHHSKGLEFPVVILPDLGKSHNLMDASGPVLLDRAAGIGLSGIDEIKQIRFPTYAKLAVRDSLTQQMLAEELRVLYVAMTRAREQLILVGTVDADDKSKWETQWRGHIGAIPAEAVLAGRRMVDWLGPVAQACPDQFTFITHDAEDVSAWTKQTTVGQKPSETFLRVVSKQPLPGGKQPLPVTQFAIDRLSFEYPFRALTEQRGATTVTALAKGPTVEKRTVAVVRADTQAIPTGSEIGDATHRVMQFIDFSIKPEQEAIEREITRLVNHAMLDETQKSLVDVGAVLWFMQSELGQLMRTHRGGLYRELPLTFMIPASDISPGDKQDQVMVRGRIDAMLVLSDRVIMIDYKTDRVAGAPLESRLKSYRAQINLYADEVAKMLGKPVSQKALVLLHHRQVESA